MSEGLKQFFAAWGETNAAAREEILRAVLNLKFSYVDPRMDAPTEDLSTLNDYIGQSASFAPGAQAKVVITSTTAGIDRATVAFEMPGMDPQMGQYVVEYDATGTIIRMIGFAGLGAPD
ncbi:MAG: molecular chaperone GroEL [Pseudomonadota bacterium]